MSPLPSAGRFAVLVALLALGAAGARGPVAPDAVPPAVRASQARPAPVVAPLGTGAVSPVVSAPAAGTDQQPGAAANLQPVPQHVAAVQPLDVHLPPPPPELAGLRVPPGNGAGVSLTFDDGPWPQSTRQVLALLTAARAPAVFCLIGRQARGMPDLVREEVSRGFVLCDHSRDHDLHMRHKGAPYEIAEVDDGLRDIQEASGGASVPFYRQPGGLWDPVVVGALQRDGLSPLRWSDDPRDWSRPGVAAIAQRVLLSLRPDGVVLLHDGGGDRTQTVQVLSWLLQALPAAGWHFTLPTPAPLSPQDAARPE